MKIPSPYKNYPDGYALFVDLIKARHKPNQMGFHVSTEEVYRFTNRFRVAKAFLGMNLDNYRSNTVAGYDALFRVFLAYSSFELFMKMMGQQQSAIMGMIAPYNPVAYINLAVSKDNGRLFYNFLHQHVNATLKNHLSDIYSGVSQNITYLASSIRHIFAHGHLSAHANKCEPLVVKEICDCVFDFHMNVMDSEFTKAVNTYKSTL
jgi:hypothetical protein